MQKTKPKKIIIITFLTVLIVAVALLITYYSLNRSNKNKILAIPKETGAISSPLPVSVKEGYDELYNLLDRGEIKTDYFDIKPLDQDRTIQITVKKPLAENKTKAETWLTQNGYGDIPSEKIVYLED